MNHRDEMTGWIPYSKHENLLQIMYRFGGFSGCLITLASSQRLTEVEFRTADSRSSFLA